MNIKKLNASELPELAGVIKDLVNWGKWNLYEIQCKSNINAKYALSNEEGEYLLDINGIPMPPTIKIPSYITI